jgi:hypothetical protein
VIVLQDGCIYADHRIALGPARSHRDTGFLECRETLLAALGVHVSMGVAAAAIR